MVVDIVIKKCSNYGISIPIMTMVQYYINYLNNMQLWSKLLMSYQLKGNQLYGSWWMRDKLSGKVD